MTVYPLRLFKRLKHMDFTVITFRFSKNLAEEEILNNVKIIRLPFVVKISKGFLSPQSILTFISEVRRNDVIVINIPNFEALPLVLFSKIFRKKVISIFLCKVFLNGGFLSKLINTVLNASVYVQLSLSDKIVVIPDYVESLSVYHKFKNKISKAVPLIEELQVDPQMLKFLKSKKADEIWLGIAGRISREKGIDYLLDVLAQKDWKDKKVRVIFAGSIGVGEGIYYEDIKKQLSDRLIPSVFLGKVTDAELGAFFKSIDVLVFPSINETEAFGIVQAEAMLLGTPVVSSNLPGVRLAVRMSKMGLSVNVKDSKAFSNALKKVLENKNKFTNERLLKKAKKIFSQSPTVNLFEKILTN